MPLQGLLHLHSRGLVHRDVKTPNLLVDAGWRCKVRAAPQHAQRTGVQMGSHFKASQGAARSGCGFAADWRLQLVEDLPGVLNWSQLDSSGHESPVALARGDAGKLSCRTLRKVQQQLNWQLVYCLLKSKCCSTDRCPTPTPTPHPPPPTPCTFVLQGNRTAPPADVFAYGVCLWELMT